MAGNDLKSLKRRRRSDYPFFLDYRLRWNDDDRYQHVNNSVYNYLFDSVVNAYLINHCGMDPASSPQHGLAVHSRADFFASIAFPAVADVGLRVNRLGNASVEYEVALFEQGKDDIRAVGSFVHVFVENGTGRPSKTGMEEGMRKGLEKIYVNASSEGSKL